MNRVFFAVVGMLFFSAVLGVPPGRSADVPSSVSQAVDKAKSEVMKTDDKDKDKKDLVDINSASEKELGELKGIDKDQVKKIIKNRPYARKDELVSKKVIGEKAYDRIKDQIIAKQGSKEIVDINNASEKEIAAINGISDDQAKKIVKNRPYARKDELVSKKILDERTYDKVKDQLVAKQSKDAPKADAKTDVKSTVSGAVDSLTGKNKK